MSAKHAAGFCKRLIIFDFDFTLISCNSDEHIFPMLTNGKPLPLCYTGGSWLGYMNRIFECLHSEHKVKADDICRALATIPFIAGIPELIRRLARQPDNRLMVLSDANEVFIEKALEANHLRQCFSCIITNNGEFDESGRLHVYPNEDQEKRAKAGTCPTQECPENLCKGSEIERIKQEYKQFGEPEIWYVGDGYNDWCAAVQLSEKHHVFARSGFSLHSIISKHLAPKKSAKAKSRNPTLKCNASFWHDGNELAECMSRLDPKLKDD